ncbi:CAF17-like 4Fe-4S cluster assembly/insertion protein YgfZ [Salinicola rhizosphaerae]|uniref:tRNA-modifying protein YgfZ n=1 Tax=Salinicola rhizosphaerae TaxID=1443141 RepID=A0ABQ3DRB2_9GAMM|nr:folate-binding protein YgfZ [Salinicola rhizosphaerae]GHB09537.1 tRNA-modifying protein YgfZ [Salinicola rhizosphaerae]
MNDWMAHLKAHGGRLDDGDRWHFSEEADTDQGDARLVPLTHLAIIACEGPDAARFLQGQMSANIDHANGQFAPLTAFCSPKGRMLANAEILKTGPTAYRLILDATLADPLIQQLGKYAPFYKIELKRRDDLALIGLIGSIEGTLPEALPVLPTKAWHMAQQDESIALRLPSPSPRWLLALPQNTAIEQWGRLTAIARPADDGLWQRADIDAGVAWLNAEHSDSLLPQMINWEALGGISFRKGCYTGQEVVARAHFRGQVKRRLQIASLADAKLPAQGSEVLTDEGKRVGELFRAQPAAGGASCDVLVIVNTALEEDAALSVDGRRLELKPLPYPLERLDPESAISA